jgi:hypothetical protein
MGRDPTARRLVIGVCVLLLVDVVGGLLAIANDVNTAGEAWSGDATLAAPLVVGALAAHRTVRLLRPPVMSPQADAVV